MKIKLLLIVGLALAIAPAASAHPQKWGPDGERALKLLDAKQFKQLDGIFDGIQSRFERGELSELELRTAYRPFYRLSPARTQALDAWAATEPSSYPAHLARGVHLRRMGDEARGGQWFKDTPPEKIAEMSGLYVQAKKELEKSMSLTPKPFLSTIQLMVIALTESDTEAVRTQLRKACELLPQNRLARVRYLISLTPRWGGSYAQMANYIAQCKAEGVNATVINVLTAMMEDDQGVTLEEEKKPDQATPHFQRALDLGKKVGGDFRTDVLFGATYYLCAKTKRDVNCP